VSALHCPGCEDPDIMCHGLPAAAPIEKAQPACSNCGATHNGEDDSPGVCCHVAADSSCATEDVANVAQDVLEAAHDTELPRRMRGALARLERALIAAGLREETPKGGAGT
jgi:hypothetical protein